MLSILYGEMKSHTVFQIDEMCISHVRRNDCLLTVPNSHPDVTDMSVTNSRRSKPSSVFEFIKSSWPGNYKILDCLADRLIDKKILASTLFSSTVHEPMQVVRG